MSRLPRIEQTARVEESERRRFRHVGASYLAPRKLFKAGRRVARGRYEWRLQECTGGARRVDEHDANGHTDRSFTSAFTFARPPRTAIPREPIAARNPHDGSICWLNITKCSMLQIYFLDRLITMYVSPSVVASHFWGGKFSLATTHIACSTIIEFIQSTYTINYRYRRRERH